MTFLPCYNTPLAGPDKRDELRLLINSRHPITTVETSEEGRVEAQLADVTSELDIPFYTWSVTLGLVRRGNDQAMEMRKTRPLSVPRREDIARLRAWAADRAVPAN